MCPDSDSVVGTGRSVEAVQRRLASLVSIPVGEQILIVNGTPLDPHQTLATYKLPVSYPHPCYLEGCRNMQYTPRPLVCPTCLGFELLDQGDWACTRRPATQLPRTPPQTGAPRVGMPSA